MVYEISGATDGVSRLMRVVERELAGEFSYGEFSERFLPLWSAYGTNYRAYGLTDAQIVSLLRQSEPLMVTVDEDIIQMTPLDPPVEVHRGGSASRPLGLSWSTEFDVACTFAVMKFLQDGHGAVATATIPPNAVVGAIELQKAEDEPYYEYLVDTSRIDPPTLTPANAPHVIEGAIRDMDRRMGDERFKAYHFAILRWRHRAAALLEGRHVDAVAW